MIFFDEPPANCAAMNLGLSRRRCQRLSQPISLRSFCKVLLSEDVNGRFSIVLSST